MTTLAQQSPARRALALWLTFFALYAVSSGTRLRNLEGQGHYVTLARWMLEGHVSSATPPPLEDVVLREGRYYIAFPVLPALLLLPFVAIGEGASNPVVFTAAFGAANVVLAGGILRAGLPRLGAAPEARLVRVLTVAFALGTAHWYSAAAGTVWFTSQVCGLFFLLLAVREAFGPARLAVCGLCLGLATASRPQLAFALPFFLPLLAPFSLRRSLRPAIALVLPLGLCVAAMLGYNLARFGSLTDFSYTQMNVGPVLKPFLDQGLFSLRHVGRNAFYALAHVPLPIGRFPFFAFDPMGNSLLFTSPFLVGALLRKPATAFGWAAAAATLAVIGVDLCYFSSGYAQFGYRYALDAMPFLLLLAAAGYAARPLALLAGLTLASVLINLLGMLWILNWPRMWSQWLVR